jgi:hypothetical protein
MRFSIKHLLFCMAVVAFELGALTSDKPVLGKLIALVTLGILIAAAYGAWLSQGELRAFRVGFLCWAVLYFLLFNKAFDVGVHDLIRLAYLAYRPPMIVAPGGQSGGGGGFGGGGFDPNFYPVCHSLFLLLLGLIGGWVTVYFYRKRQKMLTERERNTP